MSTAMRFGSSPLFVPRLRGRCGLPGSITNDGSDLGSPLQSWQHAGENLEAEIFFVAQAVGSALEDADFIVEAFDEAERDLVFRFAVGGDAVPMAIDQVGEALVGPEALPFEAGPPVLEETPRPTLAPVIPELAECLLEDVGRVEALVGGEQNFERAFALQGEVFVP